MRIWQVWSSGSPASLPSTVQAIDHLRYTVHLPIQPKSAEDSSAPPITVSSPLILTHEKSSVYSSPPWELATRLIPRSVGGPMRATKGVALFVLQVHLGSVGLLWTYL